VTKRKKNPRALQRKTVSVGVQNKGILDILKRIDEDEKINKNL